MSEDTMGLHYIQDIFEINARYQGSDLYFKSALCYLFSLYFSFCIKTRSCNPFLYAAMKRTMSETIYRIDEDHPIYFIFTPSFHIYTHKRCTYERYGIQSLRNGILFCKLLTSLHPKVYRILFGKEWRQFRPKI